MKDTTKLLLSFSLVALLVVASAGKSLAHYDHDDKGWIDEHHDFITHHGHRGYWDKDDSGAKIFINI